MKSERLSNLHLLPPQATGVWATNPLYPAAKQVPRRGKAALEMELPLFWYEPPWIRLPIEVAGRLAASVANLDVVVSALRRDVASDDEQGELFAPIETSDESHRSSRFLPRMTPYRAERYGFLPTDFDDTMIVDVRLSAMPNASGRLAYSPEQLKRWERASDDSPIGGGGHVATASFPTDVVSLKQARIKLEQLRQLAPNAAVFVSIGCYSLEEEVSASLVSQPDGLIVRMDQPELEGIQLAALVRRTRSLMDEAGCNELPLWIVPGEVSARDVAKLIALGASAVAIDSWCNPLVDFLNESLSETRYDRSAFNEIPALASQHLWDDIDHVIGLHSAISPDATVAQRLGTFHPRWAKACDASLITP